MKGLVTITVFTMLFSGQLYAEASSSKISDAKKQIKSSLAISIEFKKCFEQAKSKAEASVCEQTQLKANKKVLGSNNKHSTTTVSLVDLMGEWNEQTKKEGVEYIEKGTRFLTFMNKCIQPVTTEDAFGDCTEKSFNKAYPSMSGQ
ncbi:hypothetical protein MNBD_GAMMA06-2270 [hydrothermal vent metagenome]|uniref:Uncharacterized protein n=1 Tax=hydrothermal vent metagenome TaxID=652676 RepID=A0A3B0WME3_9ZZZZ